MSNRLEDVLLFVLRLRRLATASAQSGVLPGSQQAQLYIPLDQQ